MGLLQQMLRCCSQAVLLHVASVLGPALTSETPTHLSVLLLLAATLA
jgi:hypothetical protein